MVYWGGGPVENRTGPVGEPASGTTDVLVKLSAKPGSPCEGDENQGPQALWAFSSDACGVLGLPDAILLHAGHQRLLLGSVAESVLRHAACPILVVRA